jgi:hypothetical protein
MQHTYSTTWKIQGELWCFKWRQGRRKLLKVGGGQVLKGTFRKKRAPKNFFRNNIDLSFQKCPLGKKCNLNDIFHARKGHFAPEKRALGKTWGCLAPPAPPPVPTPLSEGPSIRWEVDEGPSLKTSSSLKTSYFSMFQVLVSLSILT